MTEIVIPQAFQFLIEPKRYKAVYGGRGSGKSHSIARILLALAAQKPLRIACAREIQKSIRDSVHKLIGDIVRETPAFAEFYQVQETRIIGANGSEFIFIGLKHNTRDLKSLEGVDICWIEEAENVSEKSYEILIPTIRKDGSEIWASFNVRNVTDPTYRRFVSQAGDDTTAKKVSWRDNPFFPQVLRDEMEKLQRLDHVAYLHIWEGEPDERRNGHVYGSQIAKMRDQGRITKVPYDPSSEVFTAWDLGYADSTSIWFAQFVGRELRVIDFYENSNEPLSHYVEMVKGKGYNYSTHWLPHDGNSTTIVGVSVASQLRQLGLANRILERETEIYSGIEMVRAAMGHMVIDSERCADGIKSLENYAYEWDDERGAFKSKPRHDWTSHAADGMRYLIRAVNSGARTASIDKGKVRKVADLTFR